MENETGFTPNDDLVLVKPLVVDEVTPGGIVLAEQARSRHQKAARVGHVLAIGDTAAVHPRMKGITVGTQVLFARYAADELPINGIGYFTMRATAVMGPITKLPDYELGGARPSLEVFGANKEAA